MGLCWFVFHAFFKKTFQVTNVTPRFCKCSILTVGRTPLKEPFRGMIRQVFGAFVVAFLFLTIVPSGFLPWEIQVAFPGESQLWQWQSFYPAYSACWTFRCFHNPPNSDMDYKIFKVCTVGNACDCTQGCTTNTVRESALKVDSGRKNPLPHQGIKLASAACRSDALWTELHPRPPSIGVCVAKVTVPRTPRWQLAIISNHSSFKTMLLLTLLLQC